MSQNGTDDSKALKRLVVMFDGTGNTRQSLTNVSRMFEAIDDSHPKSYKCIGSDADERPPSQGPASTKLVQCGTCNQPMLFEPAKHEGDDSKVYLRAGVPCGSCQQLVVEPALQPVQLVRYITGVGTNKLLGWATARTFGYGLSDKIKEGYTWLCENYQEGDEVFVFGFSRGAFAARSLVSLLHRCHGVLKKTPNSEDHDKVITEAYNYYVNRDGVKCTDEKNEAEQRKHFIAHLEAKKIKIQPLHVPVKMLGVWDTVGALGVQIKSGIPFIDNSIISREHYMFHEQGLSCIVENAYHALALDEYREHFEPTLWTSRASTKQEVKQVWFVGSHCNVGGGADLDDNDDPDDLWQYSYVWMQRHAEKHGLRFFWSYESPATRQANSHFRTRRVSLRTVEPSYGNFLFYSKIFEKYVRKTDPKLAMLHWSVIARIKITDQEVEVQNQDLGGKKWEPYRPEALLGNHCSHKRGGLFSNMLNFLNFGRTSEGVGSPGPEPTECLIPKSLVGIHTHGIAEFMATVIPEGTTEVAPDQVNPMGGVPPRKWHIETDDVMTCTQWALETHEKNGKGKKIGAKKVV